MELTPPFSGTLGTALSSVSRAPPYGTFIAEAEVFVLKADTEINLPKTGCLTSAICARSETARPIHPPLEDTPVSRCAIRTFRTRLGC